MLTADPKQAGDLRKFTLPEEKYNATNFLTLWDFEGVFKYSPLFYGWYTNKDSGRGYRLPFAYFVTGLVVYAYSFFATLRKMAENSRMSKLSEKDDECIFSWKLFTAWDYMIGNAETAHNRVASIVMGFKEALLEEAEKKKQTRNWKVIGFRVLVNTVVVGLLSFSAFAVIMVVKRSTETEANSTVWRKNEITIVMSLITLFFPMLFEVLGLLEQYHPRKQLRLQLARIMVLNLLNLYSLIFALFDKILDMTSELQDYRNLTKTMYTTASPQITNSPFAMELRMLQQSTPSPKCFEVCTDETDLTTPVGIISALAYNISIAAYPKITQLFNATSIMKQTTEQSNNVSLLDYNTDAYDNYTLPPNITDMYDNETSTEIASYNVTNNTVGEFNFDGFANSLFDYLTYILSQFEVGNNTNMVNNSYTNETLFNFTYNSTEAYNVFKSTILPEIDTTEAIDERFEFELSTLYDEITTTIESFKENFTEPSLINCTIICENVAPEYTNVYNISTSLAPLSETGMNYTARARLRQLCWETMFGQELLKLTVMDFIMTVLSTLSIDFFRGIFVRVMNRCWCWDLEKKFPQYGDFKVAENILHLVNNQGMVWMGMFFSPGLVVLNVIKLYLMMYFRAWAVLTCNVPHEIIFRASRSNNFYYALLLMMLFLCVLPVGYAIVWVKPSWHCGPFSTYQRIFHIFTKTIRDNLPPPIQAALDYIASPGIVIPLLVLLVLIIYYLISLTGALREANVDLKIQLRRERTEERRKMFQMADRRRRGGSGGSNDLSSTPFNKWKKLLGSLPSGKSFDDTPRQESEDLPQLREEKTENKNKDFFAKFIKRALGKSSTSEEDQNVEDATDTEQPDSLPEDVVAIKDVKHKPVKPTISGGSNEFSSLVQRALSLKNNPIKSETNQNGSSDSSDAKHVQIQNNKQRPSVMNRRDTFDLKRNAYKKKAPEKQVTSRQDSGSSIWSDNIPVITISKTESAENILDENLPKSKSPIINEESKNDETKKFKPKIRCALKKQSSEIDEDVICHFSKDLNRKISEENLIKSLAEEEFERKESGPQIATASKRMFAENEDFEDELFDLPKEEITDKSSSEETELKESSDDTILNSPYMFEDNEKLEGESGKTENQSIHTQKSTNGSGQTESSTSYKDINI